MSRILVVDDEQTLVETISYNLRREGFEVEAAGDGQIAVDSARARPPDVVVLDIMLPGIDGLEVCRRIRRSSAVPILMLTARGDEMDRIIGLEVGADDYLPKPFSMRELLARIRALLRRRELLEEELRVGPLPADGTLVADDLVIDVKAHRLTVGGREIPVTPKEFMLLEMLVRHRGQVLSPSQLLELVWGYLDTDTRTVAVHIRGLRAKIETDPSNPTRIETVRGVGYRYTKS